MGAMASQITSLTIVYSIVYSSVDQRKHQSSASLAFVRRIHRWPVNSLHKWPVTREMFPFDDVIMVIFRVPRDIIVHLNIVSSFIENKYEVINVGRTFLKGSHSIRAGLATEDFWQSSYYICSELVVIWWLNECLYQCIPNNCSNVTTLHTYHPKFVCIRYVSLKSSSGGS